MANVPRRRFLKRAGVAGLAVVARSWRGRLGWAQSASTPTRVVIDPSRQIAALDRRLFGSFLEHLGRAIYTGIYGPGSKFADSNGFRTDVSKEIHDLGLPIVRWPGANFVSGYHWLDGVGPQKDRPRVLDRAWNTLETNQFGTNEFMTWCRQVGTEPLMGMNFGTGTAEMAAALTVALFVLNRDLESPRELQIDSHETAPSKVNSCEVLTGSDLKAVNTFDAPNKVVPQSLEPRKAGTRMTIQLPARSYAVLSMAL